MEIDPMGISDGGADEYQLESEDIIKRLESFDGTKTELAEMVTAVFKYWFDEIITEEARDQIVDQLISQNFVKINEKNRAGLQ